VSRASSQSDDRQSFRFVIQPFADLGFDVIAVDYRGAGGSNKPTGGYDKMTMSRDIHTLYHEVLGISSAIICGYDIGSMVACSLALQFRDDVTALITLGELLAGFADTKRLLSLERLLTRCRQRTLPSLGLAHSTTSFTIRLTYLSFSLLVRSVNTSSISWIAWYVIDLPKLTTVL
jgi:pimeloyl-ACP methyl ester carboxylesterase